MKDFENQLAFDEVAGKSVSCFLTHHVNEDD